MNKITTFEKRFVDEMGRERIFHGVNVVDKSIYTPGKQNYMDVDEALIKRFADSGFNLIRLGFTWAKIEPQPEKYNDEYIDSLSEVIDWCEKYNIFVFLDAHQDLYSSQTQWGDGAPEWAFLNDGIKPKPTRFVWAEGYFWGKACHRAFDNFWANKQYKSKGLQDYYAEFWKYVVKRLGDKPPVIGFDMMNEPFLGKDGGKCFRDMIKKAAKVILFDKEIKTGKMIKDALSKDRVPKVLSQITYSVLRKVTSVCDDMVYTFDTKKYAPFISKVSEAIREINTDGMLFMENCYYSNLGIPFSAPPITINGKREPRQVFAPHAYDLTVDTSAYKFASSDRVGGIFAEHKRSQDRLNVPVIVGEWGGFGENDASWLPHIEFLLNLYDQNKWSNTYWCYISEFFDFVLMDVLIRPYPKAISGEISEYHYDLKGKTFTVDFNQSESDCGESIICAPLDVASVEIDSAEAEINKNGTELYINTAAGKHSVTVRFK